MSRWSDLPKFGSHAILYQLPVEQIISFCQVGIFSCSERITRFDETDSFWKNYYQINPYNYIKYKITGKYNWEGKKIKGEPDDVIKRASMLGNRWAVFQALQNGAKNLNSALVIASRNGYNEIVKLLLSPHNYGFTTNRPNNNAINNAFQVAARGGFLDTVQMLFDQGVDIDYLDGEILFSAVEGRNIDVIRFLVNNGADANVFGGAALPVAAENGDTNIVDFLLKNGVHVEAMHGDINEGSAIDGASENGHFDTVKFLLANGAPISGRGPEYETAEPLYYAAKNGHIDIVELLLNPRDFDLNINGADIHAADWKGISDAALVIAAENGHTDVVKILLDRGANIHGDEYWPEIALRMAHEKGHKDTVQLLLDRGADENYILSD